MRIYVLKWLEQSATAGIRLLTHDASISISNYNPLVAAINTELQRRRFTDASVPIITNQNNTFFENGIDTLLEAHADYVAKVRSTSLQRLRTMFKTSHSSTEWYGERKKFLTSKGFSFSNNEVVPYNISAFDRTVAHTIAPALHSEDLNA